MALIRKKIAKFLVALFIFQCLLAIPSQIATKTAASANCGTATVTNLFDSSSLNSFPADFSNGLSSAYVGYSISGLTNPYIKITGFVGGKLALATNQNDVIRAAGISPVNGNALVYVYLKASSVTFTEQKINYEVYEGNPTSGTLICSMTQTFSKGIGDDTGRNPADIIKASSNKVDNITSNFSGTLGVNDTFTVTVTGDTGQWQNTNAGEFRRIVLTPSTNSAWPASAYQLIGAEFRLNAAGGFSIKDSIGFADSANGSDYGAYTAVYTYLINNANPGGTPTIAPVNYIDSGTQLKHTNTNTGYTTLAVTTAATYTLTLNSATGGSTSASAYSAVNGDTVTLNAVADTGYTFTSWNCSGAASISSNTANPATLTFASSNVTCSPVFTANPTYSVTYHKNGANSGTVPIDSKNYSGTDSATVLSNTGNLILSNYTFDGWCTTQPSAGTTCAASAGTQYSANDTFTVTSNVTLYAIWKTNSSSGGGTPAPVYVPNPPTITSISAPEICAVGEQLLVKGTYLTGATATIDGAAVRVVSSSSNELLLALPMAMAGVRTLKVTNADGSASTTVKYTFVDTPVYVNYTYPLVYKDLAFSYTFSATDAAKYAIQGRLPAGLTIDPLTGEVSGTPTVDGDFTFTIVASNVCGNAYLNVYMFIDKAIPDAFTCSVAFNVPSSDTISEIKLAALRNCLDKVLKSGPNTIDPVIFLSGGVPPGLTQEELLNHPRYTAICELLNSMGIIAQIIVGAFDGDPNQVQIMVYWPEPLDV